jgi:hypothetical protein
VAKEAATINGRDGTSDHHIYLTEQATEATSYRARIERAGVEGSTTVFGESITTGVHEARQIVLDMIIDDGQTNARTRRLNRRQVFNENFHIFAAHTADHTKQKRIVHMEYADAIIGKASTALTHQYDMSAAMTAEICDRQCFEHPLCEEFFLHKPSGGAQECGENGDKQCVCTLYGKATKKDGAKESCDKEQCFAWQHRDSVCGGVNVVATELSSKASGETLNSCAQSCHAATGCTQFYFKRSTGACVWYSGACQ